MNIEKSLYDSDKALRLELSYTVRVYKSCTAEMCYHAINTHGLWFVRKVQVFRLSFQFPFVVIRQLQVAHSQILNGLQDYSAMKNKTFFDMLKMYLTKSKKTVLIVNFIICTGSYISVGPQQMSQIPRGRCFQEEAARRTAEDDCRAPPEGRR